MVVGYIFHVVHAAVAEFYCVSVDNLVEFVVCRESLFAGKLASRRSFIVDGNREVFVIRRIKPCNAPFP